MTGPETLKACLDVLKRFEAAHRKEAADSRAPAEFVERQTALANCCMNLVTELRNSVKP